jgi:predicted nucleic acid-binding protein
MQSLLRADSGILTWWSTRVEVTSAVARLVREGQLVPADQAASQKRLGQLRDAWEEVAPADQVRVTAARLLRTHPLRAADALQLAAALEACDHRPEALPFVTLDQRLGEAAQREGFEVLP